MRQAKGLCVLVLTVAAVIGYFGTAPAHAADPSDMPAGASGGPPPTPAPNTPTQGQMSPERMHKMREACGPDVKKFCHDVKPGGGRIIQCLEQHKADVSQTCNQLLSKK